MLMFSVTGDFGFLNNPRGYLQDQLLLTGFESHQNIIHIPMKIDTAHSISSFQLTYRSLPLANFQSKNNIDPLCNLDLKS